MIQRTAVCVVAAYVLLFATISHAQLFRAYLSVNGSDTNPCTVASPCRLLPAALNAVASGGEIWILDSGNFNTSPVDIGKSVNILAIPGAVGSFVADGGPALTISTAGVSVALHNVVLVGFINGTGTYGIHMTNGASLTVDDSTFLSLPSGAIYIEAAAELRVANCTFRDSGSPATLWLDGATATIKDSRIYGGTGRGIYAYSATRNTSVTVTDTVVADAGYNAFEARSGGSNVVRMFVTRCTATHDGSGFGASSYLGGPSLITVANSMATGNTNYGFFQTDTGSVFRSLGNNDVHDNGTDTFGTIGTNTPR